MNPVDSVLAHYGIKGMKWGIRRTQAQLDAVTPSEDAAKAAETKSKIASGGLSSVSNTELKALADRMRLEQDYQRLVPVYSKPENPAARFIKGLSSDILQSEVSRVAKAATSIVVEKELKKELAGTKTADFAKEVGQRISPKKKK